MGITIKMTKAVQRAVERATPKTLQEAGRYIWRIARASIKQRRNPNKASKPGSAPHSHANSFNTGFKKTIIYALDNPQTEVIGPMLVRGGLSNIARVHEFGGNQMVREMNPAFRDGIKVGMNAPVTVSHLSSRDVVLRYDRNSDPKTGRRVAWIRIRTKTQQSHSNRLYKRMNEKYGRRYRANYPARPYMKPALDLGKPKLSSFWYNAVKP